MGRTTEVLGNIKSHLLSVWKQECRPTRKGWLEACSKTCFSVWTQSMSWWRNTTQIHPPVRQRSFRHCILKLAFSWIITSSTNKTALCVRQTAGRKGLRRQSGSRSLYWRLGDNVSGYGCCSRCRPRNSTTPDHRSQDACQFVNHLKCV